MTKYSAKDLFSTWYSNALKREINADELTKRRTSIDNFLKEKDTSFWVEVLKMCFRENVSEEAKEKIIKYFKDIDDTFQVLNNENQLHILACCAVAEKIQENVTFLSDSLALAVLTSLIIGKSDSVQIPDFILICEEFWLEECSRKRIQPDIGIKNAALNTGKIEFKQSPASAEFVDEVKVLLNKIAKDLIQLHQAQSQLPDLAKTIEMLSEESNVLWWLFGSYSRDNSTPFTEISYPESLVRIGKELSDLTEILPGLSNIDSIISKCISINLNGKDKDELSFSDFVNSVPNDIEATLAGYFKEAFSAFTPCLSSIKLRSEFSEDKDNSWQKLAVNKYKVKSGSNEKSLLLVKQLYLEIMLSRAIDNIK